MSGRWERQGRLSGRSVRRRQLLGSSLAALGAAAVATACGRGRATRGAAPTSAGQAAKPRRGGTFRGPTPNDPYHWDPTTDPQSHGFINGLTSDGLLDAKTGADVKYTDEIVQPGLADHWENPDPQTYTFHLHPGTHFANLPPVNGRELTSADIKFSYEYLSRTGQFANTKLPAAVQKQFFSGMDRIDTPDALTVVIHFQTPFAPFINYMAMREYNPILAHEIYDQDGGFDKRATVGTGPWQLDMSASQEGTHWVMNRNQTYFKTGLPYIDTVDWLVLTDTPSQMAAFQAKQIDMLPETIVPIASVPTLKRDNPQATVNTFLDPAGGHLFENVSKPPLNDIRVRKAILLSTDRNAFLKAFSNGQGEWAAAGGVVDLFTQAELEKLEPYDPTQAKQLLSAAGFASGLDLELLYPTAAGREHWLNVDQLIQAQLKQIGINATLKPLDVATFNSRMRARDYDLCWQTKAVQGDPDSYIYYTMYSKAVGNYGNLNDPVLDKLILGEREELDAAKRKQILRQAVQRIADQAWAVGYYYGQGFTFVQPYLKNFAENALDGYAPIYNSWLAK
jgi:peptide/nickel transport system substrate-binding protein